MRLHDARVEAPAALPQQAGRGHLEGERVLEGVFGRGEQGHLVEQLGGL